MTQGQVQQQDYQQIIACMIDTIILNPAMDRIAMRHKALSFELLSLSHTIANFLKYSNFTIEHDQVNFLLSFYNPPIPAQQTVNSQQNDQSTADTSSVLKEAGKDFEKKEGKLTDQARKITITMAKAREMALDLLKKQTAAKTLGQIKEFINEKGFDINKNSLKAVLTNMKKEGLIENSPEKGGWFINK